MLLTGHNEYRLPLFKVITIAGPTRTLDANMDVLFLPLRSGDNSFDSGANGLVIRATLIWVLVLRGFADSNSLFRVGCFRIWKEPSKLFVRIREQAVNLM